MSYEVWTVGGGYYLYDIFNYLAAFTASSNYEALMRIAITGGVAMFAFTLAMNGSAKVAINYIVAMLLVSGIAFGPKAQVVLNDTTTPLQIYGIIDNVPWSVALVGSITSTMGRSLTNVMETLLAAPNDLTYQKSGMMFGATILSQASRWRAVTPIVHENLVNFLENCMVEGSNLGIVDTGELGHAGSLETHISGNLPQALAYYDTVLGATTTCSAGWPAIQANLNQEVLAVLQHKAASLGGAGNTPLIFNQQKIAGTLTQFQNLMGLSSTGATASIKQSMLIIALDDSVKRLISTSGNGAAMAAYQQARIDAQTRASQSATGIAALKWVPLLKITFECLYYAMFPIAMFLMFTPLSWTVMKGYFGGFVWLASWDPLSAILQSILMKASLGYYREAAGYSTGGSIDYVMSFANHLGIRAVEQDIGGLAGYLMMSVPVLSAVILFGAGKMAHLATTAMAPTQGVAGETGREVSTGNISLGNVSMSNMAANKWNTSSVRDEGAATERLPDGTMKTTNADGSTVFATGSGQSTSNMRAGVNRMVRSEMSERSEEAQRNATSAREDYSSWRDSSTSEYAEFGRTLSRMSSTSKDASKTTGSTSRQDAQKSFSKVQDFARRNGIDVQTALNIGLGTPASMPFKAAVDLRGLSSERIDELQSAAEKENLSDTVAQYTDAVDSIRTSEGSSEGSTQAGGTRHGMSEGKRLAEAWSSADERSNTVSQAEQKLRSEGFSYDSQLTDVVIEQWQAEGYSLEQIPALLHPKTKEQYAEQDRAFDAILPQLLNDLGLLSPGGQALSGTSAPSRPADADVSSIPLISNGSVQRREREAATATIEGQRQSNEAAFVEQRAESTQSNAEQTASIQEDKDKGVVPAMVNKGVDDAKDLIVGAGELLGFTGGGSSTQVTNRTDYAMKPGSSAATSTPASSSASTEVASTNKTTGQALVVPTAGPASTQRKSGGTPQGNVQRQKPTEATETVTREGAVTQSSTNEAAATEEIPSTVQRSGGAGRAGMSTAGIRAGIAVAESASDFWDEAFERVFGSSFGTTLEGGGGVSAPTGGPSTVFVDGSNLSDWVTPAGGGSGQIPHAQSQYDRDIAIRTVIGEAANEGEVGWAAVAHVIGNRVRDPRWSSSAAEVSLQHKQFSAWNKGAGGNTLVNKYNPGDATYERVGAVVDAVFSGKVADMTGGATHYYSPAGMTALVSEGSQNNSIPTWLKNQTAERGGQNVAIKGHIFTGRAKG